MCCHVVSRQPAGALLGGPTRWRWRPTRTRSLTRLPHPRAPLSRSIYFNPTGGKPGILGKSVAVSHTDHPADWFEGLPPKAYQARIYTKSVNKYGVKAGQDQAAWEQAGWIRAQDPRGWFQWFCRFYEGG